MTSTHLLHSYYRTHTDSKEMHLSLFCKLAENQGQSVAAFQAELLPQVNKFFSSMEPELVLNGGERPSDPSGLRLMVGACLDSAGCSAWGAGTGHLHVVHLPGGGTTVQQRKRLLGMSCSRCRKHLWRLLQCMRTMLHPVLALSA
jgi:hypothetical protein